MTLNEFLEEWNNHPMDIKPDGSPLPYREGWGGSVLVHTSGSTGRPKPMWVEKQRMLNSARITCDFLDLKEGDNALLCMSLDYIAGKMMVVRSIERGMNLVSVSPSNHPLQAFAEGDDAGVERREDGYLFHLVAMVPSQVYCSLKVPEERAILRQIRHLIIGGGAINSELANELQRLYAPEECKRHFVWSTYGMTETLSHIALRRLNGEDASEWYTPFDSVDVSLTEENCLVIDAPLVHEGTLTTNDIAEIRDRGGKKEFRIIGRRDNVICSGGIKLQIEEIEDALRPFLQPKDADVPAFCITKRRDEKFGEVVVLLVSDLVPEDTDFDSVFCHLSHYSVPKSIIRTDRIPLTETGKIDRSRALQNNHL